MEFKIGNKVQFITVGCVLYEMIGKVICMEESKYLAIGVEFTEKFFNGHNCGGTGKRGYCWYVNKKDLIKIGEEITLFNH